MRIAFIHSFYRSGRPSGENETVLAQAKALQRAGHDVRLISRHTDDHTSAIIAPLASAVTVVTGFGPSPLAELQAFRPDIVHVHNLFPNYGDRWVAHWDGPLVVTVHNFRSLCANALLWRDGHDCTLCPDTSAWAGIRHRCYRDSAIATVPLAMKTRSGSKTPLLARADYVLAPSAGVADVFAHYGLDPERISVVPHGVAAVGEPRPGPNQQRWITFGRLDTGKGHEELVNLWPQGVSLDIAGDGPLAARVAALDHPNVSLLGHRSREWLASELPGYTGSIFPSLCRETFGLATIEALSCGLPVAARRGNAGAEIISRLDPDWVYEDALTLHSALSAIRRAADAGRAVAYDAFDRDYREDLWVQRIVELYERSRAG